VRSLQQSLDEVDRLRDQLNLDLEAMFLESFKDPSTQPDNPTLVYREPFYQSIDLSKSHFDIASSEVPEADSIVISSLAVGTISSYQIIEHNTHSPSFHVW
jgi:hypothetical protein